MFHTQDRRSVRGLVKIRLATLNIRSERSGGMEAVLRELRQGNVDVGVLQETKLTYRICVRQGEGYFLRKKEAESKHRGVI